MTAKEKLSQETQIIADFVGDTDMFKTTYKTVEDVTKILERIIKLNFSYHQFGKLVGDTMAYGAAFTECGKPFRTYNTIKPTTTSLEANYRLILKFIDEYKTEDNETVQHA